MEYKNYNNDTISAEVHNAIKSNYEEFLELLPNSKLAFVKLLKEYTGLGLKESKENADVIFNYGINSFKKNFGIQYQRREKLEALKTKLLTKELAHLVKDKSEDDLVFLFSKLENNTIEDILTIFLNHE